MANEDFLINEKDFEIPEGWSEVGPKPQGSGAPVPAVPVDRFASGAVSTMTLGLNTDIAASKMGGDVPSFRIQPPQPSSIAAGNSAVQSVIKLVPSSPGGTSGTSNVSLTAPKEFIVTGSPGNALGLLWATENPFLVLASPAGDSNGTFNAAATANGAGVGVTTASVSIGTDPSLFALCFITQEAAASSVAPTTPSGFTVFDTTSAGAGAGIFLQSPAASSGTISASSTLTNSSWVNNPGWCASLALFGSKTGFTPGIVQQRQIASGNLNQGGTPPPYSKAFTSSNTAGNMILIFISGPNIYHPGNIAQPASATATDTNANTYLPIINNALTSYTGSPATLTDDVQHLVLVALDINAGANTVTVQMSGGLTGGATIEMYEISGLGAGPGVPRFRTLFPKEIPPISASSLVGLVPVAGGGTGDNTLTAHGVLIGEGASPVAVTSAGTTGQVLTSNGAFADPTFQTPVVQTTTTSLSSAQILALVGTPVAVVSNPGAGLTIQPLSIEIIFFGGSIAYTDAGGAVSFGAGSATQALASNAIFTTATSPNKQVQRIGGFSATDTAGNPPTDENTAFSISKATNNFAAGNGTAKIIVQYVIVPTT